MKKIFNVLLATAVAFVCSFSMVGADKIYTHAEELDNNLVQVSYSTHVQTYGWQDAVTNGATAGTSGESKRLEGIKISVSGIDGGIRYKTHVQTYGDQDWVYDGAMSGTNGESKRLEAIQIELTGNAQNEYDIYYRVHVQTFGWQGWVKNGAVSGTAGYSKRLEAIQIQIVPKDSAPVVSGNMVEYSTHVQTYGWQVPYTDGGLAGTVGESKRLEAIKIKLLSSEYPDSGISYSTQVQTYGWQNPVSNGAEAGTDGESKRLESIKINLTGSITEKYAIAYRAHVQTYGWTTWKYNGQEAGSTGLGKRLECIEIKLVPLSEVPTSKSDSPVAGEKTIRNMLLTAVSAAGRVPYGNSNRAVHTTTIGIPSGFTTDCSGYTGWVVYNTLFTKSGGPYLAQPSSSFGSYLQTKGHGSYGAIDTVLPGDIICRDGHVFIVIGRCSDGSYVLIHSSSKGRGVELAGTGYGSEAQELAKKYMTKYTPLSYTSASDKYSVSKSYLSNYHYRFRFNSKLVSDPDNYYSMNASQILSDLYGE